MRGRLHAGATSGSEKERVRFWDSSRKEGTMYLCKQETDGSSTRHMILKGRYLL